MVAPTSNDVANQALSLTGDNQPPVSGQSPTFDNSPAGLALQKLYAAAVATVARQWGWDMARNQVALSASGNSGPFPMGFLNEYLYPANGIQLWQLIPATVADANDPRPLNWCIGNALVSSVQTKVIWVNGAGMLAVYNNNPNESTWDPLFREAVVRLLASELAYALAGRPDTAEAMIQTGGAFESLGEARED